MIEVWRDDQQAGFFSLTVNSFTRPKVRELFLPSKTTIFISPFTTNKRLVLL